jgi:hypothetical protein
MVAVAMTSAALAGCPGPPTPDGPGPTAPITTRPAVVDGVPWSSWPGRP